jgi:pantetheine-phosphate adenylyltransferase
MTKIAIYPGTFDPVTFGHVDIIKRAVELFDHVIVAVARDSNKNTLFNLDERLSLMRLEVEGLNVSVEKFDGLLVDFARSRNSKIIVRGLRAVSDFEYEFQMFGMNAKLDPSIHTVFLPASETNHFIASRFVKEVARLGGDISSFVSSNVAEKLYNKIK